MCTENTVELFGVVKPAVTTHAQTHPRAPDSWHGALACRGATHTQTHTRVPRSHGGGGWTVEIIVRAGTAIRAGPRLVGSAATRAPLHKARAKQGRAEEGGVHKHTRVWPRLARSHGMVTVEVASSALKAQGFAFGREPGLVCGFGGHARSAHPETTGAQTGEGAEGCVQTHTRVCALPRER